MSIQYLSNRAKCSKWHTDT